MSLSSAYDHCTLTNGESDELGLADLTKVLRRQLEYAFGDLGRIERSERRPVNLMPVAFNHDVDCPDAHFDAGQLLVR